MVMRLSRVLNLLRICSSLILYTLNARPNEAMAMIARQISSLNRMPPTSRVMPIMPPISIALELPPGITIRKVVNIGI